MLTYKIALNFLRAFQRLKPVRRFGTFQHRLKAFNVKVQGIRYIHNSEDSLESTVQELCQGDPELEKKLRILMLEVEVMRQDGRCAPNFMQSRHWNHLLTLPTKSQRSNYLLYLWKTEKSKENEKAKKEAKRNEMKSKIIQYEKEYEDDLLYGLSHQALFLRIRDKSINSFDNYRTLQAMMHSQSLVLDCSYNDYMVLHEALNSAKQLTLLFGENRIHKDPFDIHLCNVKPKSEMMIQLERYIPSVWESWFPINIHEQSYLDIFPKKDLVYLTPHCRNELTEFNHDAVYIVGCMVDKANNEPLSLAKAKRDDIQVAKLPLDRYLEWAPGAKKNLNINHVISILLDLRLTGDWEYAFRHIPRRKLMETKVMAMQKKLKQNILSDKNIFQNRPQLIRRRFNDKKKEAKRTLYDDDNL